MGNLSWQCSRDDLYELFGKFGQVQDAFIPSDRETGKLAGGASRHNPSPLARTRLIVYMFPVMQAALVGSAS